MWRARDDVQFSTDPDTVQVPGIGDAFISEDVELAHLDVGRRKPGEVRKTSGRGVGGNVRAPEVGSEQCTPAGYVVVVAPRNPCRESRVWRGVSVVEHRVDENLFGDGRPTLVTRIDRETCCDATASAVAHDRNARRVDAEFGGVRCEPLQTCVAVRYGDGCRTFRRLAIRD